MSKRKGSRSEYKSRDWLEKQGYRVTRAGGSLGVWDLVAISPVGVQLIQVKTNRWPGTLEMERMVEFPAPPWCAKLIHRWDDYARAPNVRKVA